MTCVFLQNSEPSEDLVEEFLQSLEPEELRIIMKAEAKLGKQKKAQGKKKKKKKKKDKKRKKKKKRTKE
jgi:hypothetical protein